MTTTTTTPCRRCADRDRRHHAELPPELALRRWPPTGDRDLWVRYGPDGPPAEDGGDG